MNGDAATAPGRSCAPPDASHEGGIRHGTPAFLRTARALFLAGFASFGLLYCVQPLLPQFTQVFGVGAASSALSLSLSTGTLAVSMLAAGILSDAIGRRPVMLAALFSSALLSIASALVDDWSTVLVLRTLLGVSLSGVPAVAMTYLVEEMDRRSLGLAMGLYIGGNAFGGMSGRLIAGIIADHWGWRAGVLVVSLLALAVAVLFWRQLPASRNFHPRRVELLKLPQRFGTLLGGGAQPWLVLIAFVLMGLFVTLYNFLGFHLQGAPYHLSQTVVGLIFSLYLIGTFSSAWMGQLATRRGRGPVLVTSFCLVLGGILLLATPWLPVIVAGIAIVTFGFFGGHSVASSWVGASAGALRAEASALYLLSYYLGSSVAGVAGGVFYSTWGWPGVCVFTGSLALVGLLAVQRLLRRADARVLNPSAG